MYTIMNAVRLLIWEKRLPKSLKNKIAAVIIHVKNRSPSKEDNTFFKKCSN